MGKVYGTGHIINSHRRKSNEEEIVKRRIEKQLERRELQSTDKKRSRERNSDRNECETIYCPQ